MNKTSTSKLLVAVMAFAVAIAGIAVIFSDSEVNAAAAVPESDPFTGMYDSAPSYDKDTGAITVNKDTTIKFSKLGKKAGPIGACMLSRSKLLGLL